MKEGEGNTHINESASAIGKNLNEHPEAQADSTPSKSDSAPKTRRNGSKKKAKPATTENESKENDQQAEAETSKEKPKKKKARKPKKKANHEDDKENVVPYEDGAGSVSAAKSADTADPKHSETSNENPIKSSKKAGGKKKKASTAREPLSEVANQELQQGEYSIDYQSLHDALRDPFTLDDKRGPIYFAPLTNKIKHQHREKAAPKFSYSTSATGDASRNSNKSSPSAK
ncbi:hypothetical protein MBANPS3_004485, partial [Mucor bainieri]